jgi:hypothetical protein
VSLPLQLVYLGQTHELFVRSIRRHDTQHNDNQHDDIQHSDIKHRNDQITTLGIMSLERVSCYAGCHLC